MNLILKLTKMKEDKNTKQDFFLDYEGLCSFLHISYGTARNWKSSGKLTYTTINGKVLFSKKYILEELKKNTIKSTNTFYEDNVAV